MSALPLQPEAHPWPPAQRRIVAVLALALVVLLVGLVAPRRAAPPRLILGGPDLERDYAREARRLIDGAQERVWMTMYVVRVDEDVIGGLLDALASAHDRGVDVRVALDLSVEPDDKNAVAHQRLAARGVRVIRDEPDRTTHAKLLVIDGRTVLAGSHNWTRSALSTNREATWLVDDRSIAADAERWLAGIPGW